MSVPFSQDPAADNDEFEPNPSSVPSSTIMFFAIGWILLITAALSLTHLNGWMGQYGTVPVFIGFFFVMSLAGRWIWRGIDTFIAAARAR